MISVGFQVRSDSVSVSVTTYFCALLIHSVNGSPLRSGHAPFARVEGRGHEELALARVRDREGLASSAEAGRTLEDLVEVAEIRDAERDVLVAGEPRQVAGGDALLQVVARVVGDLEASLAQAVAALRARVQARFGDRDSDRERRIHTGSRRDLTDRVGEVALLGTSQPGANARG